VGEGLPGHVEHVSARDYRSPSRLPDGAILVVGSGPTGQQIADEVARSGRRVFLAVGRHRPLPRRYRGADAYVWLDRMGSLERDVDTLPDPGSAANGEPVQRRGVTGAEGLMFLGLRFMHRRNSNFIDGVGADAEFLARRIVGSRLFDTAVA
jgi:hypothetical protein